MCVYCIYIGLRLDRESLAIALDVDFDVSIQCVTVCYMGSGSINLASSSKLLYSTPITLNVV